MIADTLKAAATTAAGGLAGVVIGWASTALTLVGEVHGIQSSVTRIEQRLDAMAAMQAKTKPGEGAP